MKIYKIAQHNISVANVGFTNSTLDKWRLETIILRYLMGSKEFENLSEEEITNKLIVDNINFQFGRDFLKENKQYNIVILHYIYNPSYDNIQERNTPGPFKRSELHDRKNWISRLISTNAEGIFVFGDVTEVSGGWLGELPGYESQNKNDLTIYTKNENI